MRFDDGSERLPVIYTYVKLSLTKVGSNVADKAMNWIANHHIQWVPKLVTSSGFTWYLGHFLWALTTLLHKPPEQSFLSYTLDLRTKFPLNATSSSSGHPQPYWRDHALSLEKQLNETQERMQKVQLELHKLRETSIEQQRLVGDQKREEEGQSNRPKKRRKIQADTHPPSFDWNEAMKTLDPALWAPSFRGDLDMLNTLVRLTESTKKENHKQKIFPLVKQSLTLVGGMLQSVLTQPRAPSSHTLLKELASLVPFIIDQSLPLIFPPSALDAPVAAFVQTVHEQILQISVIHFNLLSDSAASSLLKRRAKDSLEPERLSPSTDSRPVLLGLCQTTLNSLKPYPQIQSSVSVILSYSIATQLRKCLDQLKPANDAPEKKSSSTNDRIRRLAFKDTFWYLASVLNTCFCSLPSSMQRDQRMSPLEEAARTRVLVSLAEMLENKDGSGLIGLVERNMLIGVVEQAWKNGWAPFSKQQHEEAINFSGEETSTVFDDDERVIS